MSSYQTAKLQQYEPRFLEIAEDVFERVRRHVPEQQVERHEGSFSVYGRTVKDTAAKIVIYDPQLGRANNWPRMRDGVYVWVRETALSVPLFGGTRYPLRCLGCLRECGEI